MKYKNKFNEAQDLIGELHLEIKALKEKLELEELKQKMRIAHIHENVIEEAIARVQYRVIDGKIKFSEEEVFNTVTKIHDSQITRLFG